MVKYWKMEKYERDLRETLKRSTYQELADNWPHLVVNKIEKEQITKNRRTIAIRTIVKVNE